MYLNLFRQVDLIPVVARDLNDRADQVIHFTGDERARSQDRVDFTDDNRSGSRFQANRFSQDAGTGAGSTTGGRHHDLAGQALAKAGMGWLNDRAGRNIKSSPKTERDNVGAFSVKVTGDQRPKSD